MNDGHKCIASERFLEQNVTEFTRLLLLMLIIETFAGYHFPTALRSSYEDLTSAFASSPP